MLTVGHIAVEGVNATAVATVVTVVIPTIGAFATDITLVVVILVYARKLSSADITVVIVILVLAIGKLFATVITVVIVVSVCVIAYVAVTDVTYVILAFVYAVGKLSVTNVTVVIVVSICALGKSSVTVITLVVLVCIFAGAELVSAAVVTVVILGIYVSVYALNLNVNGYNTVNGYVVSSSGGSNFLTVDDPCFYVASAGVGGSNSSRTKYVALAAKLNVSVLRVNVINVIDHIFNVVVEINLRSCAVFDKGLVNVLLCAGNSVSVKLVVKVCSNAVCTGLNYLIVNVYGEVYGLSKTECCYTGGNYVHVASLCGMSLVEGSNFLGGSFIVPGILNLNGAVLNLSLGCLYSEHNGELIVMINVNRVKIAGLCLSSGSRNCKYGADEKRKSENQNENLGILSCFHLGFPFKKVNLINFCFSGGICAYQSVSSEPS